MQAYNFNKNKITRSFMLIYFILRLKNYIYNISLEIHPASSGKRWMLDGCQVVDGFLAKYCIYSFLVLK